MDSQNKQVEPKKGFFDKFSNKVIKASGSPYAFSVAVIAVIVWASSGSIFNYSDTWQLIINTSTTIITFLMVFIIQQSQNKENIAIQLKLNELIAANKYTSNRLVNVENLGEDELKKMAEFYYNLSRKINDEPEVHIAKSIDELGDKVDELKEVQDNMDKDCEDKNEAKKTKD